MGAKSRECRCCSLSLSLPLSPADFPWLPFKTNAVAGGPQRARSPWVSASHTQALRRGQRSHTQTVARRCLSLVWATSETQNNGGEGIGGGGEFRVRYGSLQGNSMCSCSREEKTHTVRLVLLFRKKKLAHWMRQRDIMDSSQLLTFLAFDFVQS